MNLELLFLQYVKISIVVMGSILTWLSFKGYKRTNTKGLLFISIGFGFVTAGSYVDGLLFDFFHFGFLFSTLVEAILVAMGLWHSFMLSTVTPIER